MAKRKRMTCSNCGKKGHNRTRCVEKVNQAVHVNVSQTSPKEDTPSRPQSDERPSEGQTLEEDLSTKGHDFDQPRLKRAKQEVDSQETKSEARPLETKAHAEEKGAQDAQVESSLQSQASLVRLQEEASARRAQRAVDLTEAALAKEMEKRHVAEAQIEAATAKRAEVDVKSGRLDERLKELNERLAAAEAARADLESRLKEAQRLVEENARTTEENARAAEEAKAELEAFVELEEARKRTAAEASWRRRRRSPRPRKT